jgi:iron complex outermembrane receptor protein
MRAISCALLGVSIGAIAAGSVQAQATAQAAPPSAGASENALQEIVVTAQKRVENLQRVPIAVTAASGAKLEMSGITNSLQLNTIAPGLNIRTTAGSFQPSIRGIGTSSNVVENPVALYIDGVYLPQQREGMRQLDDIAQVAVLKGPQGTLFGRNATGGVIQITTLAPSHQFSGLVKTELDNYLTTRTSAYVTGGLGERVAASFSASYAHQDRGWGKDLTTGNDTFRVKHDLSLRGKLLFQPSDRTSVTLIADYTDRAVLANSYQPYRGLPLVFAGTGPLTSVYDSYAGQDGFNKFRGGGISLTVNQDLSFAKLVSITSYRRGVADYQFDNSAVPSPYFVVHSPISPNEDYTQEIQLVSRKSDVFNWVVGAFYFHNANGSQPINRFFSGPVYAPLPTSAAETITRATETTESLAPFAQATLHLLPRTNLTVGIRYTYEKRTLDDASIASLLNNGVSTLRTIAPTSLTIRKPTFRAAIDHRLSDDVLIYASFNTGIKSGGFNIVSPANPAYLPEKLTAYEVGFKSELFDHHLRFNAAAFYYDYTNLQVIQFVGITQSVVNGPGAKLYGLDVDYELQLARGLRASGGFEIAHSEFTDYPGAVFSTPRVGGGATIVAGDATGRRLPLSQKFTATTSLDYTVRGPQGRFDFDITANYNGNYYFEADNFLRQNAYTILNASVKWTLPGDRLSFTLFGKNLFDNHVITQVSTQGLGYPATYGSAPRTYGILVQLKF